MTGLPNPYVGPRAFEAGDLFFGRSREIRQLKSLLIAERLVLLHSPSGAGKTSLIQAGLLPLMEREGFHVLPVIRVNAEPPAEAAEKGTNRYLVSALLSLEESVPDERRVPGAQLSGYSLAEYLDRRYRPENMPRSELLVFDQFEEILTTAPNDREGKLDFFARLGDALNNPNCWALFAIREDFLGALAPYLRYLPNRLNCTFRLDLLGREAALQAIQKPAEQSGVEFTGRAARQLVENLSSTQVQQPDGTLAVEVGMHVEPVQLQVVCFRLWHSLAEGDTTIDLDDLEGVGDVDQSLAEYYQISVEQAVERSGVSERKVRGWFEDRLILPGEIRGQVPRISLESDELNDRMIQVLIDAHIIRAEKRGGITWYELAHDRLIGPIRQSNAAWRAAHLKLFQRQCELWLQQGRSESLLLRGKELNQAETEAQRVTLSEDEQTFLAASQKAYNQAKREKRRNQVIAILAIAALIALLVAGALGFIAQRRSSENQELAKRNAEIARTSEARVVEIIVANSYLEAERQGALHARSTAEAEKVRAENATKTSLARQLAARSQNYSLGHAEGNILCGLLAVEAARYYPGFEANQALRRYITSSVLPVSLMRHQGDVSAIAFSPNGNWVVSSSDDGTARVWEAATGNEVARMQHGNSVTDVAFSPDGNLVVSGSADYTARVWEAATGREVARMQHDSPISTVAFSPNSELVVSGSSLETMVRVWEAVTGNWVAHMQSQGYMNTIAISPSGRLVVSGGIDGTAHVWDIATEKEITHVQHYSMVSAAAFSPDSRRVVSGAGDGTARVWDAATGTEVARIEFPTYDFVTHVAFSPDGKWVASGSRLGTVKVWASDTGDEISRTQHNNAISALAISPDGKWVASGSLDNTVRVWEAATGKEIVRMQHNAAVTTVAFSPDGKWVASGSSDNTARVWKVTVGTEVVRMQQSDSITDVAFSPDGRWVVSGNENGIAQVWEASTGKAIGNAEHWELVERVVFSPDGRWIVSGGNNTVQVWEAATGDTLAIMEFNAYVVAVDISPDGRYIVSGDEDQLARVWEFKTGKEVARMEHDSFIADVAFSPDGKWVVSGSGSGAAQVWEATTGKKVAQLQHGASISGLAFSPDGKWVVSGSLDHTARVWEAATGKEVARMQHSDFVTDVDFSPDGKWVVSGSNDGTAQVWEASTGKKVAHLQHDASISVLAFSPDGKWVVSGSLDNTARLWDAAIGTEVARIQHDASVSAVAFSPDGKRVISGDSIGTMMVWFSHTTDLMNTACDRLPRNLTRAEWQQYIGDEPYRPTCPNLPAEP